MIQTATSPTSNTQLPGGSDSGVTLEYRQAIGTGSTSNNRRHHAVATSVQRSSPVRANTGSATATSSSGVQGPASTSALTSNQPQLISDPSSVTAASPAAVTESRPPPCYDIVTMLLESTLVPTVNINLEEFSDSFLTCTTCLSAFDAEEHTPKLLNCSHTICCSCLDRMLALATPVAPREPSTSADNAPLDAAFRCPICREVRCLYLLPHNLLLMSGSNAGSGYSGRPP